MWSRGAVLGLLLAALLSGCDRADSSRPVVLPPLPSVSAAPSRSPSSRPSPSASLDVPSAARAATPAGAAAFARYWFDELNVAYATRDESIITRLSKASCKSCANFADSVRSLRVAGHRTRGHVFDIRSAEAAAVEGERPVLVDMTFVTPGQVELASDGSVVRRLAAVASEEAFVVTLARNSGHWTLAEIQTA